MSVDLRATARAAFGFGLPTVDLYGILRSFALDPSSPEYKAPLNQVAHSRRLADPADRSIVAMNVDTPYSYAWLDLRAEPMVLGMPALPPERYMSAQVVDLYTYIVGYVSPRTRGRAGGPTLVAGPGWSGPVPAGVPFLHCPTELSLVLVRTQLFDDGDLPSVAALQDQFRVLPLSAWTGTTAPDPALAFVPIPPVDVRSPPTPEFLRVLDWMLRLMPVLPEDAGLRADLAQIGVVADAHGPSLDAVLAGTSAAAALTDGLVDGLGDLRQRMGTVRSSAELFGSREFFAGDHLSRAAGAYLGILGNAAEEYLGVGYRADANGRTFEGGTAYRITFLPGGLPPVDAFWSITVYDADQHLYPNEMHRYVLGSRQVAGLRPDPDGALSLLVQHRRPAQEWENNWLPCPAGPFGLAFRTYLPRTAIRTGKWTAPPVRPWEPE